MFQGTWDAVSNRVLVYKATVSLENVISGCNQCKIEMVLWSSGIEDAPVENDDANKGFEETHFSRHIGKQYVGYKKF